MHTSTNSLSNNSGMSLIEVIVTIGITTIILYLFSTYVLSQQKENRILTEKLGLYTLEKDFLTYSANDICKEEFKSGTYNYANSTFIKDFEFTIEKIHSGTDSAPQIFLQRAVTTIGSSQFKVTELRLKILEKISESRYIVEFKINASGGLIPYKPIVQKMILSVTPSATQVTLKGCPGISTEIDFSTVGECPTDQFLNGFDAFGQKICEPIHP